MRHRTLLAASGLVVAVFLLTLAGHFTRPAEAQNPSTPPPLVAEPPALPPDAPAPRSTSGGTGIDELIEKLTRLRAHRAELDRQEKEVVDALKAKLKEQRQQLQKLGVLVEETPTVPREPGVSPPDKPSPADKLRIPPPGPGK